MDFIMFVFSIQQRDEFSIRVSRIVDPETALLLLTAVMFVDQSDERNDYRPALANCHSLLDNKKTNCLLKYKQVEHCNFPLDSSGTFHIIFLDWLINLATIVGPLPGFFFFSRTKQQLNKAKPKCSPNPNQVICVPELKHSTSTALR